MTNQKRNCCWSANCYQSHIFLHIEKQWANAYKLSRFFISDNYLNWRILRSTYRHELWYHQYEGGPQAGAAASTSQTDEELLDKEDQALQAILFVHLQSPIEGSLPIHLMHTQKERPHTCKIVIKLTNQRSQRTNV